MPRSNNLASLESLVKYGEKILCSPIPKHKIELSFECQRRWQTGELTLIGNDIVEAVWTAKPPNMPAREKDYPKLYDPKEMPSSQNINIPSNVNILHALAHIELGAIDNYWDTLIRFSPYEHQLPLEYHDNFLEVACDEARHFKMISKRLNELNFNYGDLPAHKQLLEHAGNTSHDLASRLAVIPLVQEARGLDAGPRLVQKLKSSGDKISSEIVEQIVYEERNHVSLGIKWFLYLCKQKNHDPIPYFHSLVKTYFPDGLPGPFNIEARLASNMTKAWYQPLERSKKTSKKSNSMNKMRVLFIGHIWPEPTSSAAGVRTKMLMNCFPKTEWEIQCVSPSRLNSFTKILQEENITCHQFDPNQNNFQQYIKKYLPHIVVFDRFISEEMFSWQVEKFSPDSMRVLDLQDVHFLRRARELYTKSKVEQKKDINFEELMSFNLPMEGCSKYVIRELSSILRSDMTLYVSEIERDLLIQRFQIPSSLLHPATFYYSFEKKKKIFIDEKKNSFTNRKDFIFIGNFKHAPNVDSIQWLKEDLWPLIHQELNDPSIECHIYGSYPQVKHYDLSDPKNGFYIKGPCENVYKTMSKYRVSLAPLRYGAGIKGKIADSWFSETPCLTTPIGAEGMSNFNFQSNVPWIACNQKSFIKKSIQLYQSKELWKEMQRFGKERWSTLYDQTINQDLLIKLMFNQLNKLGQKRQESWLSRLLWSNKYRTTEYMSMYINSKGHSQAK